MSYLKVLLSLNEKVNQSLNEFMNIYDDKLKNIAFLMKTGNTNPEVAKKLNSILIERLISIRTEDLSNAPLIVNKANPNKISAIEISLLEKLQQTNESREFFDEFKKQIHNLFLSTSNGQIDTGSLVSIVIPEGSIKSDDFHNLVSDYIQNYIFLLDNKVENIYWDIDLLKSYVSSIESKVYSNLVVPSEICSQIYNAVDEESWGVLQYENSNFTPGTKKDIAKAVSVYLEGLVTGNKFNSLDQILYQFKAKIVQNVTSLFELTNAEVFPKLMKKTIDKIHKEDQELLGDLSNQLDILNKQRHQVIEEVKAEKLYEFDSQESLFSMTLNNASEAREARDTIYRIQNSLFSLFISKRNEKSKVIDFQLSSEEGSYISVFNGINKKLKKSSNQSILTYFATSIEALSMELRSSCLRSLGVTVDMFISQNKQLFGSDFENEVKKEESVIEFKVLTLISNMRAQLDGIRANDLYGELVMKVNVQEYFEETGKRVFFEDVLKLIDEKISMPSNDSKLIQAHIDLILEKNPNFKLNMTMQNAIGAMTLVNFFASIIPFFPGLGGEAGVTALSASGVAAISSFAGGIIGISDATQSKKEAMMIDQIDMILSKLKSYLVFSN